MPFAKNDPNINRNGRPQKGESWAEIIREVAEETDEVTGAQYKYLVTKKLFKIALKGNISAIKEIGDRIDGKSRITGVSYDSRGIAVPEITVLSKEAKDNLEKIYSK